MHYNIPFNETRVLLLFNDVGKDDVSIATSTPYLRTITGPGQVEDAACVGFLKSIRPLKNYLFPTSAICKRVTINLGL
jgi:hypothetical protein